MLTVYEIYLGYKKTWYIDYIDEEKDIVMTFDIEYNIAKLMGMTRMNFRATLNLQFGAYLFGDVMICFENKEDAEQALEWIESNMILHKLSEG